MKEDSLKEKWNKIISAYEDIAKDLRYTVDVENFYSKMIEGDWSEIIRSGDDKRKDDHS